MPKLGVNIDHVATLRQARGENDPNPIAAAKICLQAKVNSIVCHLREDRRHVQDQDVYDLKKIVKNKLTLELSLSQKIIDIAVTVKPHHAVFVPEKRQEVTTEGGLDVVKHKRRIVKAIELLKPKNVLVSLFIDPQKKQIQQAASLGADIIEIHTGAYDHATTKISQKKEYQKIKSMTEYARECGLIVNAGHGLKYHNVRAIAKIKGIEELNIGHSIMARAIFVGLKTAVEEMKALVEL